MKPLLYIGVFFIGFSLQAQRPYPVYDNTASLCVQPGEGVGLRYDHAFPRFGLYLAGSRAAYRFVDGGSLNDHYRVCLGYVHRSTNVHKDGIINCYSLGISYNHYGSGQYVNYSLSPASLYPVSCEAGYGFSVYRLSIALRIDVIKFIPVLDFGVSF